MGEGIRRAGGGEEGKLGRKTGAAEVEAYEAVPRRTGTAGNGQGAVGRGGRAGWERGQGQLESRPTRHCLVEQGPLGTDRDRWERREGWLGTGAGAGGNGGKDRWRRSAPTISCPLKAHDKRGA